MHIDKCIQVFSYLVDCFLGVPWTAMPLPCKTQQGLKTLDSKREKPKHKNSKPSIWEGKSSEMRRPNVPAFGLVCSHHNFLSSICLWPCWYALMYRVNTDWLRMLTTLLVTCNFLYLYEIPPFLHTSFCYHNFMIAIL